MCGIKGFGTVNIELSLLKKLDGRKKMQKMEISGKSSGGHTHKKPAGSIYLLQVRLADLRTRLMYRPGAP